MMFEPT